MLYVAAVAVVLVGYVDCKTLGRRCRRPALALPGQTCAFDRNCSGLCCLNEQGKSYCTKVDKTTTDKPKRRATTKSPLKKTFQNATNNIAMNLIQKIQKVVPDLIDSVFDRYKPTEKTVAATMAPRRDSLGDGKPATMAPGKDSLGDGNTENKKTNSEHLVALNTAADVVEGTKLMLIIISTSVILSYIWV